MAGRERDPAVRLNVSVPRSLAEALRKLAKGRNWSAAARDAFVQLLADSTESRSVLWRALDRGDCRP